MKYTPHLRISALAIAAAFAFIACSEDPASPPVASAPVFTEQPRDTTVEVGATASFQVTATGATSYKWVRNDTDTLAGQTTATLTVSSITLANHNDKYKAIASNANGATPSNNATLTVTAPAPPLTRAQMLDSGEALIQNCTGCHGAELRGSAGSTPPLAYSDYFMADRRNIIQTILAGRSDSIFVNGLPYPGNNMPAWDWLADGEIASIITYIRVVHNDSLVTNCNSNNLDPEGFPICQKTQRSPAEVAVDSVSVAEVKAIRDSLLALPPSAKKGVRHH